jgi:hypothetical protein
VGNLREAVGPSKLRPFDPRPAGQPTPHDSYWKHFFQPIVVRIPTGMEIARRCVAHDGTILACDSLPSTMHASLVHGTEIAWEQANIVTRTHAHT